MISTSSCPEKLTSFVGSDQRISEIKTFCPGKAAKCQAAFTGRQVIKRWLHLLTKE